MDAWVVGLRWVCCIPSQHEKKSDQRMMWMSLVPEAHRAIREDLLAFRPETADVEPTLWMHAPGYNGGNAHDYLSFLCLS